MDHYLALPNLAAPRRWANDNGEVESAFSSNVSGISGRESTPSVYNESLESSGAGGCKIEHFQATHGDSIEKQRRLIAGNPPLYRRSDHIANSMPTTEEKDERQCLAKRSLVLRCLRWWTIRRFMTALAWAMTLPVLFFVVYLWFSQRAWESYKHKLAAQGESLDWSAFIPPSVTEEQNFGQTPFLAPLLDYKWDTTKAAFVWKDTEGYQRATNFARPFNWPFVEKTIHDLNLPPEKADAANETGKSERKEFAAHVLTALKEYDSILDSLRHASMTHSESRFNIHYEEGPLALLPHLDLLSRVSQILRLRAAAELELGKADLAFQDVHLILYIANSIKGEPFLPSQLTRRASVTMAIQCLSQALELRSWRADQLETLKGELRRVDLLSDFERTLRAARVRGNQLIDLARETRSPAYLWSSGDETDLHNGKPMLLLRLLPSGWFYQNQIEYNRMYQELVLSGIDGKAHRVYPMLIDDSAKVEQAMLSNFSGWVIHHRFIAAQFLASYPISFEKAPFAHTQILLDLAIIACDLEQYRLLHNEFPERLDQLRPQLDRFLPSDVFSGESYKYRRLLSGQFTLYSVGWNGKDDGGIYRGNVKPSEFRKLPSRQRQDDWAWAEAKFDQ